MDTEKKHNAKEVAMETLLCTNCSCHWNVAFLLLSSHWQAYTAVYRYGYFHDNYDFYFTTILRLFHMSIFVNIFIPDHNYYVLYNIPSIHETIKGWNSSFTKNTGVLDNACFTIKPRHYLSNTFREYFHFSL